MSFDQIVEPGPNSEHSGVESANASPDVSPCNLRLPETQDGPAPQHFFRAGVAPKVFAGGKEVEIIKQGLNDADAPAIVRLIERDQLTKLILTSNELGDGAANQIAACLEKNRTLTSLSLHGNRIGPAGGKCFESVIRENDTLKSLFLSGNLLDAETESALEAANDERPTPMSNLCGLVLGQDNVSFFSQPVAPPIRAISPVPRSRSPDPRRRSKSRD